MTIQHRSWQNDPCVAKPEYGQKRPATLSKWHLQQQRTPPMSQCLGMRHFAKASRHGSQSRWLHLKSRVQADHGIRDKVLGKCCRAPTQECVCPELNTPRIFAAQQRSQAQQRAEHRRGVGPQSTSWPACRDLGTSWSESQGSSATL